MPKVLAFKVPTELAKDTAAVAQEIFTHLNFAYEYMEVSSHTAVEDSLITFHGVRPMTLGEIAGKAQIV